MGSALHAVDISPSFARKIPPCAHGTVLAPRRGMLSALSAPPADPDAAGASPRDHERLSPCSERPADLSAVERVHAARAGRIAAGSVGIAGVLLLPVVGLIDLPLGRTGHGDMVMILLATWPAMGLAWWYAQRASRHVARVAARAPQPTGDPARRLHDLSEAQERTSVSRPLMALSLLLPISLHGAVALMFALLTGTPDVVRSFDVWIALTIVVVGHAHLVLAWHGWDLADRLERVADEEIMAEADRSSRAAFWWTVGASAIPGGLLYLIPPIITFVTGAAFCNGLYRLVAARVYQERALLRG